MRGDRVRTNCIDNRGLIEERGPGSVALRTGQAYDLSSESFGSEERTTKTAPASPNSTRSPTPRATLATIVNPHFTKHASTKSERTPTLVVFGRTLSRPEQHQLIDGTAVCARCVDHDTYISLLRFISNGLRTGGREFP